MDVLQVSHQQSSMGAFHFLGLKTHNLPLPARVLHMCLTVWIVQHQANNSLVVKVHGHLASGY